MNTDTMLAFFIFGVLISFSVRNYYQSLGILGAAIFWIVFGIAVIITVLVLKAFFSKDARDRKKHLKLLRELPESILKPHEMSIRMGKEETLGAQVFLPDSIRMRHTHILGATGSGKTESVILNFLSQDVARGLGAVIMDAKGDASFLKALRAFAPKDRLRIFDLSEPGSIPYNPLLIGSPLEAAQRLFSSFTWSEEYYKSKALSALQRLFEIHAARQNSNPKLISLSQYLSDQGSYAGFTASKEYSKKVAEQDFLELSGLRDQIRILCTGHLSKILSPKGQEQIRIEEAKSGSVLYFRLQSLLSPQIVSILGKLIIQHLNYLAGTAHRSGNEKVKLVPVYMDEFAAFACPEFADLISKARSAGFALHFSHQSIGDVAEVSKGFLNQITDNTATKIILRINDPDSAEFFAKSFGTKIYQKMTQRITKAKNLDRAETLEEGTQREAHQFRASPDLFKTLPTGVGSVLIAHGYNTPHGASSVLKVKFPRWA